MKYQLILVYAFIASSMTVVERQSSNDSTLFETIRELYVNFHDSIENHFSIFDFFSMDIVQVVFFVLVLFCAMRLALFLKEFVRLLKKRGHSFSSLVNNILPESAWFVFSAGMLIYYLGYAYGGTVDSFITLTLRAALSSFEMFLSKSNLIGIAENCKADSLYMFFFAFFHASAVMVSMVFAVTCFGKRIVDYGRGLVWQWSPIKSELHVFWGLNEKSILMAKDIYFQARDRSKIVFIDLPQERDENKSGQSFSGIMGLLSYKTNFTKLISDIKYILLRSSVSPASIDASAKGILQDMGIRKIGKLMRKSSVVNFFILTDDEDFNIHAAISLLDSEVGKEVTRLYCCAKNAKETDLLAASSGGKLQIIDDSRAAMMEFAMRKNEKGEYSAHPINFVEIDKKSGCVKAEKPFSAFIIGFNATGQEALRFLYEFSSFSDKYGKKTPVEFHIFDSNINAIKGELYQEIPVLPELECLNEVVFHSCNAETVLFCEKLRELIDRLNYVVIATGEDERNLHIAAMIYEYAIQHRSAGFKHFKIFVRLYDLKNEYKFKKLIETYGNESFPAIEYFGSPRDIYTKKWILDDEEALMADRFYKSYCDVSMEEYKPRKERVESEIRKERIKLLGYRRIDRKLTQDRANCKHCYTKEVLLGLRDMSHIPDTPAWPFTIEADNQTVVNQEEWLTRLKNVSICEHLRWNASHLMMGYLPMSAEEVEKASCSCDEKTKKHLCIVDWDSLPQEPDYKMYDYMVVVTTVNLYTSRN